MAAHRLLLPPRMTAAVLALVLLSSQPIPISGAVYTLGSRTPIAAAAVTIEPGGAQVETGPEGRFSCSLAPGRYQVTILASGHRPGAFDLTVTDDDASTQNFYLESTERFETMVRAAAAGGAPHQVGDAEAHSVAGTGGDPFKALMSMPGVGSLTSGLAYPVVRGASPAGTGFFFDGVRLPQLYHAFFGPAVVAPQLVEGIDFYPSGAEPRFGLVTGGVVDVRPRRRSTDGWRAGAGAEVSSASAWLDVPLPAGDVMLAGRVSYTGWIFGLASALLSPGSRLVADFADYQARFEHRLWGGTVRLLALGSTDTNGAINDDPSASSSGPHVFTFHRVDLRYRRALGPGTFELGSTLSVDDIFFRGSRPLLGGAGLGILRLGTDIHQMAVSGRAGWVASLSESVALQTGLTISRSSADWRQDLSAELRGVNAMPLSSVQQPTAVGIWLSGWANLRWTWVPGLTLNVGLRVDGYRELTPVDAPVSAPQPQGAIAVVVDPRLSATYEVGPTLRLRAAAGLFHQAPTMVLPLPVADLTTARTGFQEVLQLTAGGTWKAWRDLEVSLDVYANPMLRLVEYPLFDDERVTLNPFDPGSFAPRDLSAPNVSQGLATGAEVMLRWPLARRWFGWCSLALQRSTRNESYLLIDGAAFGAATKGTLPYAFDQSFIGHAVLTYFFDHGWSLGGAVHVTTGRPESGTIASRTHLPTEDGTAWRPLDRASAQRLPPYVRVDVRVAKQWRVRFATIEAFLDVMNASLQPEVQGFDYGVSNGVLTKTAVGVPVVLPTLGVRVTL